MINTIPESVLTIKCLNSYLMLFPASPEFIIEYYGVIDKNIMMLSITDETINKLGPLYDKLDWEHISSTITLSEYSIMNCSDYLNWDNLRSLNSEYITSEEFIDKNIDKINDKNHIKRRFSETILDKHFDKLYNSLCLNQKLSMEFIKKYADKIGYNQLIMTQTLPDDFIDENIMHFNQFILSTVGLSESIVIKYIDYLNLSNIIVNSNRSLSQRFISYLKRYLKDNTIGPYSRQY